MKIKEAIDRMGRSRHNAIVIKCLKYKDGLTYKELYLEYCKMCEKEDITPIPYTSLHGTIRSLVAKGTVRRERIIIPGKGSATRLWLVG